MGLGTQTPGARGPKNSVFLTQTVFLGKTSKNFSNVLVQVKSDQVKSDQVTYLIKVSGGRSKCKMGFCRHGPTAVLAENW